LQHNKKRGLKKIGHLHVSQEEAGTKPEKRRLVNCLGFLFLCFANVSLWYNYWENVCASLPIISNLLLRY
jgi:hypothetical protein